MDYLTILEDGERALTEEELYEVEMYMEYVAEPQEELDVGTEVQEKAGA